MGAMLTPYRVVPRPRGIYTLKSIIKVLSLDDLPHLSFIAPDGSMQCIQLGHVTDAELLTSPLAETPWRFIRITREWIPVFQAVDARDVWAAVDMEPDISPYCDKGALWVTPKGCPREQYVWTD